MTKNTNRYPALFLVGVLSSSALHAQTPPYYAPEKPNIEINLEVLRSLAPAGRNLAMRRYQERAPQVLESRQGKSRPSAPSRPMPPTGGREAMNPLPTVQAMPVERHVDAPLPRLKPALEEQESMTMVVPAAEPETPPPPPQITAPEPMEPIPPMAEASPEPQVGGRKTAPLIERPDYGLPREIMPPLPPMAEGAGIPPLPNPPMLDSAGKVPPPPPMVDMTPPPMLPQQAMEETASAAPLPWQKDAGGLPMEALPPLPGGPTLLVDPLPMAEMPDTPPMQALPEDKTNNEATPAAPADTASIALPNPSDASFEMPPLPQSAQDWLASDDGTSSPKENTAPPLPLQMKPVEENFPPLPPEQSAPVPEVPIGLQKQMAATPPIELATVPIPDFAAIDKEREAAQKAALDTPPPAALSALQLPADLAPPAPQPIPMPAPVVSSPVPAEDDNGDIFAGVSSSFKNLLTEPESPAAETTPVLAPPVVEPVETPEQQVMLPIPAAPEATPTKTALPLPEPDPLPLASAPVMPVTASEPKAIMPPKELPAAAPFPMVEMPALGLDEPMPQPEFPVSEADAPPAEEPTNSLPALSRLQEEPKAMVEPSAGSNLPSMAALNERETPPALEIPGGESAKPLPPLNAGLFEKSDGYEVVEQNNIPVADSSDREMEVASLPSPDLPTSGAGTHPRSLNIVYGVDDTDIPDGMKASLLKLAAGMKDSPNDRVTITVYASGTPDEKAAANRISLTRALGLRAFLIDASVSEERIVVLAKGLDNPGGEPDRADIRVE